MTRQYLRKCTLLVGEDSGEGLDLSDLRVQFSVLKGNLQTVNVADITIYNAAPETIRRVRDEFTRVVLSAGYGGNVGVIFDGTIRWRRYGRESATDTYLHLQAGEGDEGINYGAVSYTLDAGYSPADEYNALLTSLQPYGLVAGNKLDYAGQKAARARVLYGMVRDRLREHAATNGATWSVQGNKLQLVSLLAYLPGDAVVLTSRTGLIGMPQLTMDGVQARCLLNPSIRIDGRVHIDQKSIQDVALAPGFQDFAHQSVFRPTPEADGMFRVIWLQHIGDTRGNEWYTDIACVNLDGTMPVTRQSVFMGVS